MKTICSASQYRLFLLVLVLLASSCEKEVLDLNPKGQLVQEDLFKTSDGANAALNAAYERLCNLGSGGESNMFARVEEKSDNAFHTRSNFEYQQYEELPASSGLDETWRALYGCIQRANVVLDNIQGVPLTAAEKKVKLGEIIQGQAYFLRALSNFWLVQLYGDVPLFTKSLVSPDDALIPRNRTADVYKQIKADIDAAIQRLPAKSGYTNGQGLEKYRASKGSALALKAEVHLVLEEWQAASDAASEVIASKEYRLYATADYVKNFQGRDENGVESVFEVQYTDNPLGRGSILNTWYGLPNLVQGGGLRGSGSTDDVSTWVWPGIKGNGLVQAFEKGDIRKDVAISTYNNAPNPRDPTKPSLWMCNKYFVGTAVPSGSRSNVNFPVIRYAKTVLTAAEALNELGQDSQAVTLVNQIRTRAGLTALTTSGTTDKARLRQAIWQERRVELCYEAQRYFDLLRTGQLIPVVEGIRKITINRARVTKSLTGKDIYLWPIPQTEINSNPQTKQNPGY